jgi:DUF1680 family protein
MFSGGDAQRAEPAKVVELEKAKIMSNKAVLNRMTAFAVSAVLAGSAFAVEPRQTVVPPAVAYAARPLPLDAVRLTGGPLKRAQDLDMAYLLKLEPDRMLAYLRERAGLARKAEPYGGWDGAGRQITGHIAGHYLSAVSYMYQATGDPQFKQRADYMVDQLKQVQDARGNGYIGALLGDSDRIAKAATTQVGTGQAAKTQPNLVDGELLFAQLAQGKIQSGGFDLNGMWSPWYVEHKLFAGLRDAYRMTGNKTALDVEVKFAGWVDSVVGKLSDAQAQKMLDTEFGGMNEVLVDLYADTGDGRWLKLAGQFHHKAVIDPLAAGQDVLGGRHANTQIPKLIGTLARYLYTGDAADGNAARNFWEDVVDHHSFATGGHGYDEYFGKPDHLSGQVDGTGQRSQDLRTSESCNVYNMLKLTRRLFALKPDVRYADFQERALFNHVLASIDPSNGRTCYMVPVGAGVIHEYQDMFNDFTCCVGTGMENHALHGDGIYFTAGNRLWVNVYAPSVAQWADSDATLTMETPFPLGDTASLKVALKQPRELTISFRRPAWAGAGFKLAVNGEPVLDLGKPDSYVDVTRRWVDGDTVSILMPESLHAEPLPDNPARVALMWGPLVLAGDFGSQASDDQAEDASANASAARTDFPVFACADRPLSDWIKPVEGKTGSFRATTADGRNITLVPFYTLHQRRYGLYWDLFTPAEWASRQAVYAAEQARQKRLAAATVAYVQVGEMQPERDYRYEGKGSTTIRVDGQPGRSGGRWISFNVPVDSTSATELAVTTTGETDGQAFDVTVEGMAVKSTQRLAEEGSKFIDLDYAVPPAAIAGKKKVTVRIAARPDHELPGIFGLRVLRAVPSPK